MKKLSYLLGLLLIGGLILSSCSKDDEDPTEPSLSFLGGVFDDGEGWTSERVDKDVTLTVGEKFVFGFAAKSTSDKNLERLLIVRVYENVSEHTEIDTTLSTASFSSDVIAFANPSIGSEVFTITATDKNSLSTSISFTVTTVAAEPDISVYTGISLGSYNSPTASSFASITGETYSITELTDPIDQRKIDFVYFHGATGGHTIAAPSSDEATVIYPTIATWDDADRNNTLFGLTDLNVESYNAVESKTQLILSINNSNVELNENFQSEFLSDPAGFAVGDIIAFETYDGNRGLLKVNEVNQGATNGESTIKYDLKVAISGKR